MLTTLKYSVLIWFGTELFPKLEGACLLEMVKIVVGAFFI